MLLMFVDNCRGRSSFKQRSCIGDGNQIGPSVSCNKRCTQEAIIFILGTVRSCTVTYVYWFQGVAGMNFCMEVEMEYVRQPLRTKILATANKLIGIFREIV